MAFSRRKGARFNRGRIGGTRRPADIPLTSTVFVGATEWSPERELSNVVVFFDPYDRGSVGFEYATLAVPADFSSASWTKTNMTVLADNTTDPDGGSTADRITISNVTNPRVSQLVGNAAFVSAGMPPTTFTFYGKKGTGFDWWVIETNNVLGENRAFFNVNTGAVGTVDAALSLAAISDAGNGWWRCTVTMTTAGATGTAAAVRFRPSTVDVTVTAPLVNDFAYLWMRPDTHATSPCVLQERMLNMENKASVILWSESTDNNQPGYERNWSGTNQGAMRGYGSSQRLISTEAAVFGAMDGDDPAYTYVRVGAYNDLSGTPREMGFANGGNDTAAHFFGVGSTKYVVGRDPDGATTTTTRSSVLDATTSAAVVLFHSPGTTFSLRVNDVFQAVDDSALNVAAVTMTRSGILCSPRATIGGFCNMNMQGALLASVEWSAADRTKAARWLGGRAGVTIA